MCRRYAPVSFCDLYPFHDRLGTMMFQWLELLATGQFELYSDRDFCTGAGVCAEIILASEPCPCLYTVHGSAEIDVGGSSSKVDEALIWMKHPDSRGLAYLKLNIHQGNRAGRKITECMLIPFWRDHAPGSYTSFHRI